MRRKFSSSGDPRLASERLVMERSRYHHPSVLPRLIECSRRKNTLDSTAMGVSYPTLFCFFLRRHHTHHAPSPAHARLVSGSEVSLGFRLRDDRNAG